MKRIALFVFLLSSCLNVIYAQRSHSVPKEIIDAFAAQTDTVSGQLIQYRETLIRPEASDSAALVIFLHSAGGRGSDNLSHLGMPAVKDIYDYLRGHNIHCYFLAPQCPKTASWNGTAPGGDRPRGNGSSPHRPLFGDRKEKLDDSTPYVRHLIPFLEKFIAEHPISKSKIYILGASMGAAGVWELLAENPGFFTAAMPASGAYRGKDLSPFKHTPIVCTTGTNENSYDKNKRVIDKLRNAGADATFIPLEGMRHADACNNAFTERNLDLLFSKHR
ncbi:MAG: hypothetical protein K2K49_04670 [Duncaniella sp.]|nr:hypothetical protein [Duncaniella sp.]